MIVNVRSAAFALGLGITFTLLAGCSSSTAGAPQAASGITTSTAASPVNDKNPELWDPCKGIPALALTKAGVDPTIDPNSQGLPIHGWKTCAWGRDWYDIIVYSTHHTVSDMQQAEKMPNPQPVTINGRTGTIAHEVSDGMTDMCAITFPATEGSITVEIDVNGAGEQPHDFCAKAKQVTEVFAPYLPK